MIKTRIGLAAFACVLTAAQPARSEQRASPICLYDGKILQRRADICVQKSMMLTCSSDQTLRDLENCRRQGNQRAVRQSDCAQCAALASQACAPDARGASLERPGQRGLFKVL